MGNQTRYHKEEVKFTKHLAALQKKEEAIQNAIKALPAKEGRSALRAALKDIQRNIKKCDKQLGETQFDLIWQAQVAVPMVDVLIETLSSLHGQPLTREIVDFLAQSTAATEKMVQHFDQHKDTSSVANQVAAFRLAPKAIPQGQPLTAAPWYPLQDLRQKVADALWSKTLQDFQDAKKLNNIRSYGDHVVSMGELFEEVRSLAAAGEAILAGKRNDISEALEIVSGHGSRIDPAYRLLNKIHDIEDYETGVRARRAALEARQIQGATRMASGPGRQRRL